MKPESFLRFCRKSSKAADCKPIAIQERRHPEALKARCYTSLGRKPIGVHLMRETVSKLTAWRSWKVAVEFNPRSRPEIESCRIATQEPEPRTMKLSGNMLSC